MSKVGENIVQISGRLTMEVTTALFGKGLPLAEGKGNIIIDFARVEAVDSSAVSLMLAWLRSAQRRKVTLTYINVPDNLRSLANLYGVAESLPLHAEA